MKKVLTLVLAMGLGIFALQGCANQFPVDPVVNELVHFDFDKYYLKPEAQRALDYKIAFLKHFPGKKIFVVGHCDERGSDKYNLDLGRHRAEEIQRYLVNNGINPKRIELMTEGKRRPLVPASNKAAWAQNRRAEFYIIGLTTAQ